MTKNIRVEICFASADKQVLLSLHMHEGATIADAIAQSNTMPQFAEIDLAKYRVGVFGKLAKPDTLLREGDRVEIYRPLLADPKEARRKRAAKANKKI